MWRCSIRKGLHPIKGAVSEWLKGPHWKTKQRFWTIASLFASMIYDARHLAHQGFGSGFRSLKPSTAKRHSHQDADYLIVRREGRPL